MRKESPVGPPALRIDVSSEPSTVPRRARIRTVRSKGRQSTFQPELASPEAREARVIATRPLPARISSKDSSVESGLKKAEYWLPALSRRRLTRSARASVARRASTPPRPSFSNTSATVSPRMSVSSTGIRA
jgi:hypothetical protein